ncbi:response regulator transcription factor [Azospirillum sp. TSO35-2]|uniref:response regulator n=1 Tax=Azospirillum sp. TSO35-2 TaxID=716796 RepID=UPI000D612E6D|nr:response regulator transcription factor [Azospirillum sp. TSO35-2]PWC31202.1 chemotaxis protein CheY [Azospirillum sp. TSO35-2]
MRILIVEDDAALARGLVGALKLGGYAVDHVASGEEATALERAEPYGLVVLDLGLPDLSGFEVLTRIRRRGSTVPVMLLTAREAVADRVKGLDLGADDYLLKPFDPAEFEARVRALMRRGQGSPLPELVCGALRYDRSAGMATLNGRPLDLRKRELAVLDGLITRAGKVVPKDRLANEVFGFDDAVAPNAIELYVARLRKKLEPDGPQIRTIRGLGYLMDAT